MIVSLTDLEQHLNLDNGQDEDLLAQKLAAAEVCVANYTGMNFADAYTQYQAPVLNDAGEIVTPEVLSNAPAPLKEAVLKFAAHLYENREPMPEGAQNNPPLDVFDLVGPYRTWSF